MMTFSGKYGKGVSGLSGLKIPLAILAVAAIFLCAIFAAFNLQSRETSASDDGGSVSLTVYNDDIALVKDVREMKIEPGISQVLFTDIASEILPSSVSFRSLTDPSSLRILEQNYEYDIISDMKLLGKYTGKKISVLTRDGKVYEGYLLNGQTVGSQGSILLSSGSDGGEIHAVQASDIQVIKYSELPGGLVTRPTLMWVAENRSNERNQKVEVSYLTGGIRWNADYVAVINEDDSKMDITGWVTVDNRSGADYENARLKLVAGDVRRIKDRPEVVPFLRAAEDAKQNIAAGSQFSEESFFEYHLYTLERPSTIKNNQTKQIELLSAFEVPVKKSLIFDSTSRRIQNSNAQRLKVMVEFENSKLSGLGIPLPKGKVMVKKADAAGDLQFIGEDQIDHTSTDEKVRLYIGDAFDVVGERVQTAFRKINSDVREESYRISIRNHKSEPVEVRVSENILGWANWEIISSNRKYEKVDFDTVEYTVEVPAGGEVVIEYTVRYDFRN